MIRLACDSDDLSALVHTDVVLTYSDLIKTDAEHQALKARFAGSVVELIDRGLGDPTGRATVLDVERGARTPADCPGWFDKQHAAGLSWLTVYHSLDRFSDVDTAMGHRSGWWRWIAMWGHGLVVPGRPTVMLQFTDGARIGARVDLSAVHNDAWHPQPARVPAGAARDLRDALEMLTEANDILGIK